MKAANGAKCGKYFHFFKFISEYNSFFAMPQRHSEGNVSSPIIITTS